MITSEEATEYLTGMGIELPSFVLTALVEQANSIESCLTANYTEATAKLIQVYLIGLFGLGQVNKYISSQSAPSGASRSFKFTDFNDKWKSQLSLLNGLDKEGCAADLIPDNPTQTAHGGIWIGKAGCL